MLLRGRSDSWPRIYARRLRRCSTREKQSSSLLSSLSSSDISDVNDPASMPSSSSPPLSSSAPPRFPLELIRRCSADGEEMNTEVAEVSQRHGGRQVAEGG